MSSFSLQAHSEIFESSLHRSPPPHPLVGRLAVAIARLAVEGRYREAATPSDRS